MRMSIRENPATARERGKFRARVGLMTAILSLSTSSCYGGEKAEQAVEVEVMNLGLDPASHSPVVILQDKSKSKALAIRVGPFEAQAIALEMRGVQPPRPLTHDLLKAILQDLGVVFEKAEVSELKEDAYYSRIFLISTGRHIVVDSRPSDAIALALRFHKPIFVAKSLMEGGTAIDLRQARGEATPQKVRGITVQEITEKLAAHFDLPGKEGVLVSDASGEAEAAGLQSGDVILAVEGEKVHGVSNFLEQIGRQKGQRVSLRVRRQGKFIVVHLAPDK